MEMLYLGMFLSLIWVCMHIFHCESKYCCWCCWWSWYWLVCVGVSVGGG